MYYLIPTCSSVSVATAARRHQLPSVLLSRPLVRSPQCFLFPDYCKKSNKVHTLTFPTSIQIQDIAAQDWTVECGHRRPGSDTLFRHNVPTRRLNGSTLQITIHCHCVLDPTSWSSAVLLFCLFRSNCNVHDDGLNNTSGEPTPF